MSEKITISQKHCGLKRWIKDAYFQLTLGSELRKCMVLKVEDRFLEHQAGCFDLNIMPQLVMRVMGVLEKSGGKQASFYLFT